MSTPHVINAIINTILIGVPCVYIPYSLGMIIYFLGRQRGYKDDCDFVRKYRDQLDELYRECQGQRDEAQAEVARAHIELEAAREAMTRSVEMGCRMADDNDRLIEENSKLIEENGRLIAASVGGIDGAAVGRLRIQIGQARRWLEKAEMFLPDLPDDDDKPSGEVMAAHRGCDDGEDDE